MLSTPASPPTAQVTAGVILLSMIGVNVSALLLPAGVAAAVAAKDLSHNFLAGFFLMMVQPFRCAHALTAVIQCSAVLLCACGFFLMMVQPFRSVGRACSPA